MSYISTACRWPQLEMPGLSRRSSPAREARRVKPRAGRKRTQGWAGAGCAAYMYSFSNSLHTCIAQMRRTIVYLLECAAHQYSVSFVPQTCTASRASRVRIFAAHSASDSQYPTAALADPHSGTRSIPQHAYVPAHAPPVVARYVCCAPSLRRWWAQPYPTLRPWMCVTVVRHHSGKQ